MRHRFHKSQLTQQFQSVHAGGKGTSSCHTIDQHEIGARAIAMHALERMGGVPTLGYEL